MALWARFTDDGASKGVVAETFQFPTNPNPLFVPVWVWVEAPAETVQQSTFDGKVWVHPAPVVVPVNPDPTPDPPVDLVDPYANYIPTYLLRQRAEAIGVWEDLATFLMQSPPMLLKVLTLEKGVDPADPDLNAGFDTMQIPPLVRGFLLAHPSVGIPDIPNGASDG